MTAPRVDWKSIASLCEAQGDFKRMRSSPLVVDTLSCSFEIIERIDRIARPLQRWTRRFSLLFVLSAFGGAIPFLSSAAAQQSPIFLVVPSYSSGGNEAVSLAMADVNGDGKPDLVVANMCASQGNCTNGSVSVLLGNGDGTFLAAVTYSSGGQSPESVAVADVNGDGKPDLLVANSCASSSNCSNGTVGVLLGNGDGTFKPVVTYGSAGEAYAVAVGDVNGDGKPDVLVANWCATGSCANGTVGVLLGNGDGTFQVAAAYNSGAQYSDALALGDVNGDGKLDIVVSNYSGTASVLLGNGDGSFQTASTYGSGGYEPYGIAVADVNGDGKPDLFVTNYCLSGSNCSNGSVGVLLGNGDGTFQVVVSSASGGQGADGVTVSDVNGDGKPDLVVANRCLNNSSCANGSVGVLLGNGDGSFQAVVAYESGGGYSYAVTVSDLNGDGKPDVVVANQCAVVGTCTNGNVGVLLGNGNGSFQASVAYNPGGYQSYSAATADLNGDGKLDLIVANSCNTFNNCTGALAVLLGKGDGSFQNEVTYSSGGFEAYSMAIADVNGDGKPDLIAVNACVSNSNCNNGTVSVLLGNGDATFQTAMTFNSAGQYPLYLAVADVNGDGKPDLIVDNRCVSSSDCSTSTLGVLLGNGDGTFQAAVTYTSNGNNSYSVAVADVNGDGKPDIVVTNNCATSGTCTGGTVDVLLGNGDGTFQAPVSHDSGGAYAMNVSVADVNKDGTLDLVITNNCVSTGSCANGSLGVLLGNGDGTFQTPVATLAPTFSLGQLALADFNGDGKLDVATGQGDALFLGNGDGTFQTPITLGAYGSGIASGDFNGDGKPDLAVGGVVVLLNIDSNFSYATTTAVAASANPVIGPVTFSARVTPAFNAGTITGTITFYSGAVVLGSAPVSNGQAVLTNVTLPPGSYSITAAFGGDTSYLPSTSPVLNETATSSNTTTTLVASLNPSTYGQSVSLAATVTASTGGTPIGNVTFTDGGVMLGTAVLSNGTAVLPYSALGAGSHSITASYTGAGDDNASSSSQVMQVVNPASTTTAVSFSSTSGNLTLTATVTLGTSSTPTGTVSFMDGTTQLGAANLNGSGAATFSTTALADGTHTISAAYSGNGNFSPSASSAVSVVADFNLAAAALLPASIAPGQSATSNISITPSNGFNPSDVTFTCTIAPATNPAPTCSVGAISVTNGTGTAKLTVATVGSVAALGTDHGSGMLLGFGLVVPAIAFGTVGLGREQRKKLLSLAVIFLMLAACLLLVACGGINTRNSGTQGTPAGAYTVTISGVTNGTLHTTLATLNVQ